MKKELTELVFILDRSGSMAGLEGDTIGGFNSVLEKQKQEEGRANITTVLFDDRFEVLHDRRDLREVGKITEKEYYVRGTTALLDAVGKSISQMIHVQRRATKEARGKKVMFVIITDGMENASLEYSYDQVHRMIAHQKKNYRWEFIFLGANIDAAEVADRFGIARDRAANYHADSKGTQLNYEVISDTVSHLREMGSVAGDWKEKIEKDYKSRKK